MTNVNACYLHHNDCPIHGTAPTYEELLKAFREYVENTSLDGGVPGLRTSISPAVTIADVIHKGDRKAWESDIERAWTVIEAAEKA